MQPQNGHSENVVPVENPGISDETPTKKFRLIREDRTQKENPIRDGMVLVLGSNKYRTAFLADAMANNFKFDGDLRAKDKDEAIKIVDFLLQSKDPRFKYLLRTYAYLGLTEGGPFSWNEFSNPNDYESLSGKTERDKKYLEESFREADPEKGEKSVETKALEPLRNFALANCNVSLRQPIDAMDSFIKIIKSDSSRDTIDKILRDFSSIYTGRSPENFKLFFEGIAHLEQELPNIQQELSKEEFKYLSERIRESKNFAEILESTEGRPPAIVDLESLLLSENQYSNKVIKELKGRFPFQIQILEAGDILKFDREVLYAKQYLIPDLVQQLFEQAKSNPALMKYLLSVSENMYKLRESVQTMQECDLPVPSYLYFQTYAELKQSQVNFCGYGEEEMENDVEQIENFLLRIYESLDIDKLVDYSRVKKILGEDAPLRSIKNIFYRLNTIPIPGENPEIYKEMDTKRLKSLYYFVIQCSSIFAYTQYLDIKHGELVDDKKAKNESEDDFDAAFKIKISDDISDKNVENINFTIKTVHMSNGLNLAQAWFMNRPRTMFGPDKEFIDAAVTFIKQADETIKNKYGREGFSPEQIAGFEKFQAEEK